jgi:hypothetical protein
MTTSLLRTGQTPSMLPDWGEESEKNYLRVDGAISVVPFDLLSGAMNSNTQNGISLLTPYEIAASGTYRKVRLYWRNISADPARELYVAANAENAQRGRNQSQDPKRRVAVLSLGEHLMLISPVPIRSLVFSSDGTVAVNTHNLMITWGN